LIFVQIPRPWADTRTGRFRDERWRGFGGDAVRWHSSFEVFDLCCRAAIVPAEDVVDIIDTV
jgi:hypothetical protein